jgi:hypothetical protein
MFEGRSVEDGQRGGGIEEINRHQKINWNIDAHGPSTCVRI